MTATKRFLLLLGVVPYCAARALGRAVKKNRLVWLFGFTSIALWAFTFVVQTNGVFELDGNATTDNAGQHDWDQVYADSLTNPQGTTSGALAIGFDPDLSNTTADNIFQGGGSKDIYGIQSGAWEWTTSKPQPKDDLVHSFAAAYTINGSDLGLFVGADRYSNNGDSTIAFWFFQDGSVGLTNTKKGGGLLFSGQHRDGDLLLISDFTVGGSQPIIHAYKWSGTDATGSLVDLGVLPTNEGFAIVNGTNQPSPWPFVDTTNTAGGNTFAPGEFFEGAVDLTQLYGVGNVPCFATFMAETRSSQSPSATLSDFTPPRSFPLCGVSISKNCSGTGTLNSGQNTIHYTFDSASKATVVHNTGIGTLYNVTIVDTLPNGATSAAFKATPAYVKLSDASNTANLAPVSAVTCPLGSPTGAVCANVGTIPAQQYVGWSVSFDLGGLSAANSATAEGATASGTSPGACTAAGTVCSASSGDTCSATVTNTVSIGKSCGIPIGNPIPGGGGNESAAVQGTQLFVSGSLVAVKVNFSGTITNNGDTTLTGISVTDVPSATVTVAWPGTAGILAPGTSANYSGTYNPSSISSGNGTGAGRYGFADEIYITGATAALGNNPPAMTGCTSIAGSPAGAQSCDGKTCNICFGDPSTLGLCSPAF